MIVLQPKAELSRAAILGAASTAFAKQVQFGKPIALAARQCVFQQAAQHLTRCFPDVPSVGRQRLQRLIHILERSWSWCPDRETPRTFRPPHRPRTLVMVLTLDYSTFQALCHYKKGRTPLQPVALASLSQLPLLSPFYDGLSKFFCQQHHHRPLYSRFHTLNGNRNDDGNGQSGIYPAPAPTRVAETLDPPVRFAAASAAELCLNDCRTLPPLSEAHIARTVPPTAHIAPATFGSLGVYEQDQYLQEPVLDQGQSNTCFSYALACILFHFIRFKYRGIWLDRRNFRGTLLDAATKFPHLPRDAAKRLAETFQGLPLQLAINKMADQPSSAEGVHASPITAAAAAVRGPGPGTRYFESLQIDPITKVQHRHRFQLRLTVQSFGRRDGGDGDGHVRDWEQLKQFFVQQQRTHGSVETRKRYDFNDPTWALVGIVTTTAAGQMNMHMMAGYARTHAGSRALTRKGMKRKSNERGERCGCRNVRTNRVVGRRSLFLPPSLPFD